MRSLRFPTLRLPVFAHWARQATIPHPLRFALLPRESFAQRALRFLAGQKNGWRAIVLVYLGLPWAGGL